MQQPAAGEGAPPETRKFVFRLRLSSKLSAKFVSVTARTNVNLCKKHNTKENIIYFHVQVTTNTRNGARYVYNLLCVLLQRCAALYL